MAIRLFLVLSLGVTVPVSTPEEKTRQKPLPSEILVEEHTYKVTPQGKLSMHVHFPPRWKSSDKRPAIVFFFGGAWARGTVNQFLPQAEYLARRGMVAARADYRVRTRHKTAPDKCVEDGKSAIRWLRKNATKLGIDPERIAAGGGSAGGHVAAAAFTTKGLEGEDLSISSKPNLLILFNPVLNTVQIGRRFNMEEMAKRISPNHHLTKETPPAIIFFGNQDRLIAGAKEYLDLAQKLELTAELYVAEGAGHGFFNRPPWREQTLYLTDQFLARHGYIKGEPDIKLPDGVEMKAYRKNPSSD